METKTSNRCCNPADEGTFTALGFFVCLKSLEPILTCFDGQEREHGQAD